MNLPHLQQSIQTIQNVVNDANKMADKSPFINNAIANLNVAKKEITKEVKRIERLKKATL